MISPIVRHGAVRGVLLPGVFRPRSDTWLLARAACSEPPGAVSVLELCSGPAFAGVSAARRHGAHLTTVDVSGRAVLNAWLNGRLNRVPTRALRGDLFAAVPGERFDLIIANPPYVPGPPPPGSGAARAWDAGGDGRAVIDRICAAAPAYLAPGGVLLLVHSEVCDADATLHAYASADLEPAVAATERGPLGPLLRARRDQLVTRGLLRPNQADEKIMVLRARAAS
jgi:release factor glutamine methyltransferase